MPKKALVTLAAHLAVCPHCGLHACVTLPDGRETRHFGSRKAGRAVIQVLSRGGLIDLTEEVFLKDQLESSPLHEEIFLEEEISSPEELFEEERADSFDEEHKPPRQQYLM